MNYIKKYKIFLESNNESVEFKFEYLMKAWHHFNFEYGENMRISNVIPLLEDFSSVYIDPICKDDYDAYIDFYRDSVSTTDFNDKNTIDSINEFYTLYKKLEEKSNLPTKEKMKDNFLHIVDMLDEYINPDITMAAQIDYEKVWNKLLDFIWKIDIPTMTYHGTSFKNVSLNRESTDELTEKVKQEIEFIKLSMEKDFGLELTYKPIYNGFEVLVFRKN